MSPSSRRCPRCLSPPGCCDVDREPDHGAGLQGGGRVPRLRSRRRQQAPPRTCLHCTAMRRRGGGGYGRVLGGRRRREEIGPGLALGSQRFSVVTVETEHGWRLYLSSSFLSLSLPLLVLLFLRPSLTASHLALHAWAIIPPPPLLFLSHFIFANAGIAVW